MPHSNGDRGVVSEDLSCLEPVLLDFERAWKHGPRPCLVDFLARGGGGLELTAELAHLDLEYRLKAGETVRVEEYLNHFPDLVHHRAVALELIVAEHTLRSRLENGITLAAYLERFPQFQAELEARLETPLAPVASPHMAQKVRRTAITALPEVPGYQILGILGRGGMGVVYQAREEKLDRVVALKMLHLGEDATTEQHARFLGEARAAARLQHPNIIQIYEVGEWRPGEGQAPIPFFAMEYVRGGTLARHLAGTPQPPRSAAAAVEILAQAIHAAHGCGVIHRDLKPTNILVAIENTAQTAREQTSTKDMRPSPPLGQPSSGAVPPLAANLLKIVDFGLAKQGGEFAGQTQTGAILGTPCYMAPEQAAGRSQQIGPAADVYALGAILYEMLTGRPPAQGTSLWDTLEQVRHQEPVPPSRLQPRVPRDLEVICLKCLRKEPARRYASAQVLADDLRRFQTGEPILARPISHWERAVKWAKRRPTGAALLAVLVLAGVSLVVAAVWFTAYLQDALQQRTQELRAEQATREQQAGDLQHQRDEETQQHQRQLRHSLYVSDMRLAFHQFWQNADIRQGREVLRRHLPREGEEDRRGFEWYHLWNQFDAEPVTLPGHPKGIWCGTFAPDGKTLATAGIDGTVKLWELGTQKVRTLAGHHSAVGRVAFSPDGKRLASVEVDGRLRLWDAVTGQPLPSALDAQQGAHGLAFSPKGKLLAFPIPGSIKIWDLEEGKERRTLPVGTQITEALAFAPDGKTLAFTTSTSVRVWEEATGKELANLKHAGHVQAVAYSPTGRLLATAEEDGTISLWNLSNRRRLAVLQGHKGLVESLAFAPNGSLLASGGADNTVRLWNPATARLLVVLHGHTSMVHSVAFAPDGQRLASAGADGTAKVWPLRDWFRGEALLPALRPAGPLAFSPDGSQLAVVNHDSTVQLVAATTCEVKTVLRGLGGTVEAVAFSPDRKLLAAGGEDRSVCLWELDTGRLSARFVGHGDTVTAVTFSPDSQWLAVAGRDGGVKLWEAAGHQEPRVLAEHTKEITALAFVAAGKTLVTVSQDQTIRLWDVATGQLNASRTFPGAVVPALSSDGRQVATCTVGGEITLWDTTSGKSLGVFQGHRAPLRSLMFFADGTRLASIDVYSVVRFWDVRSRKAYAALRLSRTRPPRAVAFSPKNNLLAITMEHGSVRLWEMGNWRTRQPAHQPSVSVHAVAFAPDGKTLFTAASEPLLTVDVHPFQTNDYFQLACAGSTAHALRLWEVASGRQLPTPATGHNVVLHSLTLAPDGSTLAVGGAGGTVWLWDRHAGKARPPLFVSPQAQDYWKKVTRSTLIGPLFRENVLSLAFSPDARWLATVSEDNAEGNAFRLVGMTGRDEKVARYAIKVWEVATGKLHKVFGKAEERVAGVEFSPDGNTLVTNHWRAVRLWDVATGKLRQTFREHQGAIQCLALSRDGRTLATGGRDHVIKLWDMSSGQEKATLRGHTETVAALAFAPNGRTLASGGWDSTVRLWNLATGQELVSLLGPTGKVNAVAFTRDGQTLASGGETAHGAGEVFLWRAPRPGNAAE